jgi:hypothetical protein
VAVAVVVFIVAVSVVGWMWYSRATADDIAKAHVGDCVRSDVTQEPPYRLVSCGAAGAEFIVLRMLPGDTGAQECPRVPGAALWFTAGERIACLGRKGVDPATAVNVAQEGDCLHIEVRNGLARPGVEPLRLDCADPRANMQVLRRVHDADKFGDPCSAVPGTTGNYGWNWIDEDAVVKTRLSIDVVLCIGPSEAAKAAASASAAAQAAATDRCRFVTVEEMSAAVSRAAGRTYTAVSAEQNDLFCDYRFGGKNKISTWFSTTTDFRPGSGDETLTVDGLRAIYGPGEGTRALSVYVPTGNFTVIAYQMDGVGSSLAKKIGIEVFRVARPRLP